MNLRTVMNPETREIIEIDASKEPRWMFEYLHRSGVEFSYPVEETGIELVASSTEIVEPIEVNQPEAEVYTPDGVIDLTLEQIQARYTEVTGKDVPARYKNDTEWLLAKINE